MNTQLGTPQPSINQLIKEVLCDTALSPEQKKLLIDEIRKHSPALSDRWLYRWVIWFLGATVVLTVCCLAYLSAIGVAIPHGLVALGSAAAGGMSGLLTPSPRSSRDND